MKYKLYRSFGDLDKDVKKHELVAVEYGSTIEDVEDALIKDVADDLAVLLGHKGKRRHELRAGPQGLHEVLLGAIAVRCGGKCGLYDGIDGRVIARDFLADLHKTSS